MVDQNAETRKEENDHGGSHFNRFRSKARVR